jgi:hypothetical protein
MNLMFLRYHLKNLTYHLYLKNLMFHEVPDEPDVPDSSCLMNLMFQKFLMNLMFQTFLMNLMFQKFLMNHLYLNFH